MTSVISLRNVKKNYPGFNLDIASLDIEQGYITGFIGENGAGKTTTLRMIMDVVKPDAGEISVFGKSMVKEQEKLKQNIGYVDSLSYFSPGIKLGLAKSVIAPFYNSWDEDLYRRYCKRFEVQEGKCLKELSSGQAKLFSLIMALSHRPKLLILDEPTSSLDPVMRSVILDILSELLENGDVSIFYSTHITSDLDKTADFIVYINKGKILLNEEKDRMLEEYRIVKGSRELFDKADNLIINARESSVGFTGLTKNSEEIRALSGGTAILEKPNIEDIMVYMSKEFDAKP